MSGRREGMIQRKGRRGRETEEKDIERIYVETGERKEKKRERDEEREKYGHAIEGREIERVGRERETEEEEKERRRGMRER